MTVTRATENQFFDKKSRSESNQWNKPRFHSDPADGKVSRIKASIPIRTNASEQRLFISAYVTPSPGFHIYASLFTGTHMRTEYVGQI